MSHFVRQIRADDVAACETLLAGLPDGFGLEQSNREYIGGLPSRPSAVVDVAGRIGGFVSIQRHNAHSAEIHVAAVDRELHRKGVGTLVKTIVSRGSTAAAPGSADRSHS